MKVLFVNGCIRAEKSRTLGIAESFLEAFSAAHQDVEIVTEDLNEQGLSRCIMIRLKRGIKPLDAVNGIMRCSRRREGSGKRILW